MYPPSVVIFCEHSPYSRLYCTYILIQKCQRCQEYLLHCLVSSGNAFLHYAGKNLDVKLNNWKTSELSRIQLQPQSKTLETGLVSGINNVCLGSALHSHCRGQEFESPMLHHSPSGNTVFGRIFYTIRTNFTHSKLEIAKKGGASPLRFPRFFGFLGITILR